MGGMGFCLCWSLSLLDYLILFHEEKVGEL